MGIHDDDCTSRVKGKKAARIVFHDGDTATKMFNADKVGRYCDMCIHYIM